MPPRHPPFQSKYSHNFSATYLDNLRNNRPARPTGSRPAPFTSRNYGSLTSQSSLIRSDSAPTVSTREDGHEKEVERTDEEVAHPVGQNSVSFSSSLKGRPLAQPPGTEPPKVRGRKVSPTATVQVSDPSAPGVYIECEARKLEKEEAHSLREALELIDQKDELRIYEAAKDEAADLVWKHQNPKAAEEEQVAPYRNPDLKSKDRRRSSGHRQTSGSRKVSFPTAINNIYEEPEQTKECSRPTVQPPSNELPLRAKSRNKLPWLRTKTSEPSDTATPVPEGKKFDRFEIHRNPPTQSRKAGYTENTPRPPAIDTIEEVDTPNSRGSLEIRGDDIRAATSMRRKDRSPNLPTPTAVSDQIGRPIVSFEKGWKPPSDSPRASQDMDRPVIKLTESPSAFKGSDRPLPRPTSSHQVAGSTPAVPVLNLPKETPFSRPLPEVTVSAPVVPTINLPDDVPLSQSIPAVPTINLPDNTPDVPTISIQEDRSSSPGAEINHSDIGQQARPTRPLPKHSSSAPPKSISSVVKTPSNRLPWLNSRQSLPTVSCSSCALPISGRIVTASGSNSRRDLKARFHPECFTCHHCNTPLECVSFYPEPDTARLERLDIPSDPSQPLSPEEDSLLQNDPLRFYCHLDFHEFYSPRCRSCKTPIEGEVVIACGHSYHVDHFFCAECGDPFGATTPFVEGTDGYAYCVRCHTRRTSARCKGCRNQILDEVTVEALGGKWHEHCFVCLECGCRFGDEGRFFVRDVNVEPTDKEKRRGILSKVEERAVCGDCEERRLKA
ncbi:hypothetical protein A1O7_06675 [Cladophialophora yegresii CBS 114405]|uniref:LIM zinc-binding domain-containing protein n=1 Tax=Cladophialophora yegresii CBS 114405 TaxID=1182544 RepID=W9VUI6_9EURO|nr:uncharacterized protein A1O7_06675 [Cladophialophora yegresii CBS 114405]EXJ59243.1 hypothetical protein A1O7_06675 [Cladophialophora yegresii CBS 114405]